MQPHEYSIIGHNRATIGRHLGTLAGLLAALTALGVTVVLDLAAQLGISRQASGVILFPLNAAFFYLLGHLAFDRWIWRFKKLQALLGIPDLNGDWECEGETKDDQGNITFNWNATVTISQTWAQ